MHIHECMTMNAKACVPEQSCAIASEFMRRRRCGFVPIVDGPRTKRVVGVVTDRDIVRQLVRSDLPASRVALKACMTPAPTMIAAEAPLEEAVRRQWAYIGPHVTEQHVTEILEAIAVARERPPGGSRR